MRRGGGQFVDVFGDCRQSPVHVYRPVYTHWRQSRRKRRLCCPKRRQLVAEIGDIVAENGDNVAVFGDLVAETGDNLSPFSATLSPVRTDL